MHDINLIRNQPDLFKKKIEERNTNIDLQNLLNLDKKNRELIQNKEKFEQEKKIISKKKDKSQFSRSKDISKQIEKLSKEQLIIKSQIKKIISSLPNLALQDVPL